MSTHVTTFTVFPDDCNYMKAIGSELPMVHGGTMLLKMDRAAAECVRKSLYKTDCDSALTVGVDQLTFYFGAKLGDLVEIHADIRDFGIKRITIKVACWVEYWGGERKLMAEGLFHFCSMKAGKSHAHKLKVEN